MAVCTHFDVYSKLNLNAVSIGECRPDVVAHRDAIWWIPIWVSFNFSFCSTIFWLPSAAKSHLSSVVKIIPPAFDCCFEICLKSLRIASPFTTTESGRSSANVTEASARCARLTARLLRRHKLGQQLNTDPVMLGLGGVEMIAWQAHHAVEKLTAAREPAHLSLLFFFFSFFLYFAPPEDTDGPSSSLWTPHSHGNKGDGGLNIVSKGNIGVGSIF